MRVISCYVYVDYGKAIKKGKLQEYVLHQSQCFINNNSTEKNISQIKFIYDWTK